MRQRRDLLEQQLRDFLEEPTITVARVIIGEVDALAELMERRQKEMSKRIDFLEKELARFPRGPAKKERRG